MHSWTVEAVTKTASWSAIEQGLGDMDPAQTAQPVRQALQVLLEQARIRPWWQLRKAEAAAAVQRAAKKAAAAPAGAGIACAWAAADPGGHHSLGSCSRAPGRGQSCVSAARPGRCDPGCPAAAAALAAAASPTCCRSALSWPIGLRPTECPLAAASWDGSRQSWVCHVAKLLLCPTEQKKGNAWLIRLR